MFFCSQVQRRNKPKIPGHFTFCDQALNNPFGMSPLNEYFERNIKIYYKNVEVLEGRDTNEKLWKTLRWLKLLSRFWKFSIGYVVKSTQYLRVRIGRQARQHTGMSHRVIEVRGSLIRRTGLTHKHFHNCGELRQFLSYCKWETILFAIADGEMKKR